MRSKVFFLASSCTSFSPVHAALLGQAGDRGGFTGRLTSGPTVLSGCRGYGIDLSVVGGVFVHVLDLQLAATHRHLIPHYSLVTDNLLKEGEVTEDKKGIRKQQTRRCGSYNTEYIMYVFLLSFLEALRLKTGPLLVCVFLQTGDTMCTTGATWGSTQRQVNTVVHK